MLQFIHPRDQNKFSCRIRPLLGHRATRVGTFYEDESRIFVASHPFSTKQGLETGC